MSMIRVNASVTSTDQQTVTRAVETLSRAACGLALEGAEVYIIIGPDTDEETRRAPTMTRPDPNVTMCADLLYAKAA